MFINEVRYNNCYVCRYQVPAANNPLDDPTPDYMNLLGMIFSICGLMMKVGYTLFYKQLKFEFSSCLF